MTNSINNIEFVNELVAKTTKILKQEVIDNQQVAYEINTCDVHHLLSVLKTSGWKQLSYLSAVDWPEENKFEVVYILFNWEQPVYIQVRTKIDRENPVVDTITTVFPGAKYYEREAHEFFGIAFPGNPDYMKQLILEGWDDIPPLRKDFDPSAYSAKKFPSREYPQDYSVKDPENHTREKREARKVRGNALRTGGKKQ
ncbi:MAG: NADH-quinone oxidoreductase subunit C [Bacilli bacterium]|nr:NADH-quinone oxidoreductase subunit C [Bacilli bacterium]MBN2877321.1 NADH-quinone oxidoreductase subunit C [Bacilli bacterium]